MSEACDIAEAFPGFGDPWKLTLGQWNGALDRIQDRRIAKTEVGHAAVNKLIHRDAQRQKAMRKRRNAK